MASELTSERLVRFNCGGGVTLLKIKRALISVSDKSGVVEFALGLAGLGVEILASAGTAKALKQAGIKAQEISEYTGYPELLQGRVKTLHPMIHAGILAKRDEKEHMADLKHHQIKPIDLVVVNLYPFESQVTKGSSMGEAMEYVDIGGETLIRAAAKNHEHVGVLVDPGDYGSVLQELKEKRGLSYESSKRLAEKAFNHVVRYNAAITNYFAEGELPSHLNLVYEKALELRYGENPHQKAAFYDESFALPAAKLFQQLHGKELSYNNFLDLDAALQIPYSFAKPTAVVIKHTNPCGLASADEIELAFELAFKADEKSAFGGIIGLNRPLTKGITELMGSHFFEAVVAPDYEEGALEILQRRKGLRVIRCAEVQPQHEALTSRRKLRLQDTVFGLLAQTPSDLKITADDLKVVTRKAPTEEQKRDLLFAWKVVKWVKSNAIVLAKDQCTVGIGAGQMSRVDAVDLAIRKAGEKASGSVLASDAFFPFRDNVDRAAVAEIAAIIEPGGSVRDEEVIEAANEHGIPMAFTGSREFRH